MIYKSPLYSTVVDTMCPERCQNYDNGAKENIKLLLIIFNIVANKNDVCARAHEVYVGCRPICRVRGNVIDRCRVPRARRPVAFRSLINYYYYRRRYCITSRRFVRSARGTSCARDDVTTARVMKKKKNNVFDTPFCRRYCSTRPDGCGNTGRAARSGRS